jgi:hypothetical protein
MLRLALAPLFVLACLLPSRALQAQVRQCISGDGTLVYTDRKCEDIGATERAANDVVIDIPGQRMAKGGCSRSVQDLVYALGSAIQSGDANQVAAVYDWSGHSTADGYRLMARLDAIAKRPLLDVQPVYSGGTNGYGDDIVEFDEQTGTVVSKPPRKPRLVGIRVDQTLANGAAPSRTLFGLRRHLGCWWVRL